jgi:hypothetical protein
MFGRGEQETNDCTSFAEEKVRRICRIRLFRCHVSASVSSLCRLVVNRLLELN